MFVEDTYYSDTPDLEPRALGARIDAYVAARGWQVERVAREETGALPVAMGGDFEAYWQSGGASVAKAGMRAGLFHPLTSYSLPDAVRTASLVAQFGHFDGAALHDLLHGTRGASGAAAASTGCWRRCCSRRPSPAERYRILERFYRLDEG
jgi:lycopene beta-cyclase